MTWRWMAASTLWDMAQEGNYNLAVSLADVLKGLFPNHPVRPRPHKQKSLEDGKRDERADTGGGEG